MTIIAFKRSVIYRSLSRGALKNRKSEHYCRAMSAIFVRDRVQCQLENNKTQIAQVIPGDRRLTRGAFASIRGNGAAPRATITRRKEDFRRRS